MAASRRFIGQISDVVDVEITTKGTSEVDPSVTKWFLEKTFECEGCGVHVIELYWELMANLVDLEKKDDRS